MPEYIDREQLDKAYLMLGYGEEELPRRMLQMMPAADVAQVVRCKDCHNYGNDPHDCLCTFHDIQMLPHNFCSYGERRTNE